MKATSPLPRTPRVSYPTFSTTSILGRTNFPYSFSFVSPSHTTVFSSFLLFFASRSPVYEKTYLKCTQHTTHWVYNLFFTPRILHCTSSYFPVCTLGKFFHRRGCGMRKITENTPEPHHELKSVKKAPMGPARARNGGNGVPSYCTDFRNATNPTPSGSSV